MRQSVLFVDDNTELLQGLQRMLRQKRHDWDMQFVESGAQALALLDVRCVDVVVTDMRMPGMDGAQLLFEVKKRCPNTVRIVLSGQADLAEIIDGIDPIHQYVSKPCEPRALIERISRVCRFRSLLREGAVKEAATSTFSLPVLQRNYSALETELMSEAASNERVAEIVSQDIAMAAKLLQLVNSAFLGPSRCILDPREAAALLGVDLLRTLVLDRGLFIAQEEPHETAFLEVPTRTSIQMAELGARLAAEDGASPYLVGGAYAAGLLHAVGKFVLRKEFVEAYVAALANALERGLSPEDIEAEITGANHHQVGAYLLGLWGLPGELVDAIAFAAEAGQSDDLTFSPLTAVHIAGAIASVPERRTRGKWPLDLEYLEKVSLRTMKAWTPVLEGSELYPYGGAV